MRKGLLTTNPQSQASTFGAIEGTRTPTPLPVHGPEPCASANSATMASGLQPRQAGTPPHQEDLHPYSTVLAPTVKRATDGPQPRSPTLFSGSRKPQMVRRLLFILPLSSIKPSKKCWRNLIRSRVAPAWLTPNIPKAWSPKPPLLELRVHRDFRIQYFRHRTALLGRLGILLESRRIRARNFAHDINMTRRNGPS